MPRRDLPSHCCQWPRPCGEPLPTQASTGDPPTLTGSFASVSCGGFCSFPLDLTTDKILFVLSNTGVSVPQSCGSPIIKSCWPSRSASLGIPNPFFGFPAWEAWYGGSEPWPKWESIFGVIVLQFECDPPSRYLILLWSCPSYCHCSFFFVFGEYIFLTGFSAFLLMVINRWLWFLCSCRSTHPSTLPSWTRSPRITVKETLKCVGNAYTLVLLILRSG